MTIYYFIIFLLMGLGYVLTEQKKENKWTIGYLMISFLVLTFFASFRYAIGFDYFSYQNIYKMVAEWTFGDIFSFYWYEPFFFLLCKIGALLGCSFPIFLFIINLFLFFVAMRFIYLESKMPWISVGLYILLQFLAYNMNLVRQSIAVAFFLLAYPYLKNRKIVPFGILIFIGGLFHNSLWFMAPLYFLLTWKGNWKFFGSVVGVVGVVYYFCDPIIVAVLPLLPGKYANYMGSYFWNSNGIEYVIPALVYLGVVYGFQKQIEDSIQKRIYFNSAFYNFFINLFITKHFILERFSVYTFILSIIVVPEIIASNWREKQGEKWGKRRDWVLGIFLGMAWAYFFFAVWKGFHHVYPYVSLWKRSNSLPYK